MPRQPESTEGRGPCGPSPRGSHSVALSVILWTCLAVYSIAARTLSTLTRDDKPVAAAWLCSWQAVAELASLRAQGFAGVRFNAALWRDAHGDGMGCDLGRALFAAAGELGMPVSLHTPQGAHAINRNDRSPHQPSAPSAPPFFFLGSRMINGVKRACGSCTAA